MAISRADFWFFITELVTRNPNLGIPALEDGLFANLLIFDYLYYIFVFGFVSVEDELLRSSRSDPINRIIPP